MIQKHTSWGNQSSQAWASYYLQLGLNPIPIPLRSKNPNRRNWPQDRLTVADIPNAFGSPCNIGLLLGNNGNGLVDVDLDCDEAVRLAPHFLHPTDWKIGRVNRPESHWLYHSDVAKTTQYKDPVCKKNGRNRGMLVELHSTGAQVLTAPSIHPDEGDEYTFAANDNLTIVDSSALQYAVQQLASTALLARYWPAEGCRHDTALAVAGVLLKSGVPLNLVEYVVGLAAWASNDNEVEDRKVAVRTTADRLANDEAVRSWKAAESQIDRDILSKLVEWLGGTAPSDLVASDGRPVIQVTPNENDVADQVVDALASDEIIFQRHGSLVHVLYEKKKPSAIERPNNAPRIEPLPKARLRERITASVHLFERKDFKSGPKDIHSHPKDWLVQAIHSRGEWVDFRHLEGVVQIPVLRRDGTILQSPGYDEASGLLYEPIIEGGFAIPENPSLEDARNAVNTLWNVVSDFPFADPAKHFSAWLAALLTPLARFAFDGPAPFFLVNGNSPGAGKGLLVDVLSEIAVGQVLSRLSYSENDEEMRKRITSLAIAGDTTVMLDNINRPLGGASLDAALTAERWVDRILSTNTVFSGPLNATWYGTGNNVELVGDTARRVLEIKLETPLENPEERKGFTYPDLKRHIRENRVQFVQAAVTILRSYVVAGRPQVLLTPWGSFESWSNLVRQAIVWCGQADPGDARMTKVAAGNQDATVLSRLLVGLEQVDPQRHGMTTAQLASTVMNPSQSSVLYDLLNELAGESNGNINKRRLGRQIGKLRGRVSGGLRLIDEPDSHTKVSRWKVEAV